MKNPDTADYFAEVSVLRKFLYIVVPLYPIIFFLAKIFNAGYSLESQFLIIVYMYTIGVCAAEDILTRTIPDFYNAVIFISGLVFSLYNNGFYGTVKVFLRTSVLFAVLIILLFVSKDGIGGGDIKMVAAASSFIGTINALVAFCAASLFAVPLCLFLIISNSVHRFPNKNFRQSSPKKTKKTKQPLSLPFGPFYAFCLLIQLNDFF